MARYSVSGLLILTLQLGCVHHRANSRPIVSAAVSADQAPLFDLTESNKPAISTVSHRFEPDVTIVDARDAVEKQYYRGESDAYRWRDAVTILPVESFQPGFDKQLGRTVVNSLADTLQHSSIEVTLKSCHVTLDMRRQTKQRFVSDYTKWEDKQDAKEQQRIEQDRRDEREDADRRRRNRELGLNVNGEDEDNGVGSEIVSVILESVVAKPIREHRRRKARAQHRTAAPQTLPQELISASTEGWNCHLEIEVRIHPQSSSPRTVVAKVDEHLAGEDSENTKIQCASVVLSALKKIEAQLRSEGI